MEDDVTSSWHSLSIVLDYQVFELGSEFLVNLRLRLSNWIIQPVEAELPQL
jgi:hypothetical protein